MYDPSVMAQIKKKNLSSRPITPPQPLRVLAFGDYAAAIASFMLICGMFGLVLSLRTLFTESDWTALIHAYTFGTAYDLQAVLSSSAFWKALGGVLFGAAGGYATSTFIPKEYLSKWNTFGKILLIILPTILLYLPNSHAGFIWDDDQEITANLTFRIYPGHTAWNGFCEIWGGLKSADYFPLKTMMHWIEYQLWGQEAGYYHTVNYILHAIGSAMLWVVLRRLAVPGAWVAAFVFAIYPVHVESVAWISERKNTLSFIFYLLAFLSWFNYQEKKPRHFFVNFFIGFLVITSIELFGYYLFVREDWSAAVVITALYAGFLLGINWGLQAFSKRSVVVYFYLSSLLFCVAGLLCKSHLVILPAALLLLSWWQNGFTGVFDHPFQKEKTDDDEERRLMKMTNGVIGGLGLLLGTSALFYLFVLTHCYSMDPNQHFLGMSVKTVQDHIKSSYMMKTGAIALEFWIFASVCILSSLVGLIEGFIGLRINRMLVRTIAFFQVAVLLGALTVWFQYGRAIGDERIPLGGMPSRIANAGKASWWYLSKAITPVNPWFEMMESRPIEPEAEAMAIVYDGKKQENIAPNWPNGQFKMWPLITIYPRWRITPPVWYDFIPALLMTSFLVFLWIKRKQWGRTPVFVLAYFLVTLFPILGFVKMSYMRLTLVADHFQYLSDISIIAYFCAGGVLFYEKMAPKFKPLILGGAVLLIGVLTLYSWDRVRIYESELTLWGDTLLKNPGAWQAHNHMGAQLYMQSNEYRRHGQTDKAGQMLMEATHHFAESCRLKPENPESHNNLGLGYVSMGRMIEGIAEYRRAIQIRNWEPSMHTNLANSLAQIGQFEEAITEYKESIRLNPRDPGPVCNMGYALMSMGRLNEAILSFQKALSIDPSFEQARSNLEKALKLRNGSH